jgi:Type I restriction modification DNA specificity domain
VVHLYAAQLKELKIEIPHLEEQQKIADLLTALDTKIDAVAAQIAAIRLRDWLAALASFHVSGTVPDAAASVSP